MKSGIEKGLNHVHVKPIGCLVFILNEMGS